MSSFKLSDEEQDEVREELLFFLRLILIGEGRMRAVNGAMSYSYIMGLNRFKDALDSHNRDLFINLVFQTDVLRIELTK